MISGSAKKNEYGGYDRPSEIYPIYEVETTSGIAEVIEYKRMEPVFYVTDDPEVRAKLGLAISPDTDKRKKSLNQVVPNNTKSEH